MPQKQPAMTDNKNPVLEPGLDDIAIRSLAMGAQGICQGVDGSIFCTRRGRLYRKGPDAGDFEQICHIDDAYQANILGFDHAGHLYYAGKFTATLMRSSNYGKTFNVCLKDGGAHSFRGFAIDNRGSIYVGSYGKYGPASLYCSRDDGATWSAIKTFRCRHIHAVGVNPATSWLYVVTGEMLDAQKIDAYGLFRSKDGGQTWTRIIRPAQQKNTGWGRPLYLSIGFLGDNVVLSTDHPEGGNGIDTFTDTGEDTVFLPRRVLDYPEHDRSPGDSPPYCWGFVNWRGHLYTVCTGSHQSILYRSAEGFHWQKCATLPPWSAQKPEFHPYADRFFIPVPYQDSYEIFAQPDRAQWTVPDQPQAFWSGALLAHDQRYADEADRIHCRGYYARGIANREKQDFILRILAESNVPKDGLIADIGCGIGVALLAARKAGYTRFVGIEANPRWLIAARTLYEASFPGESPTLRLVPRGKITLPNFAENFAAVLLIGIFVGGGHGLNPQETLTTISSQIKSGTLLCFNVSQKFLGDNTIDIFLNLLATLGFGSIRCRMFRDTAYISAFRL